MGRLAQMFLGRYEHSLDEKNRVTLPARFRADLEHGVVITKGIADPCLWVFPYERFKQVAEKADALPLTQKAARAFSRLVFTNAVDDIPDRQGRVRIPDYLLQFAGIKSEALILGNNGRLEIWSPERWTAQEAYSDEHQEEMAALLNDLGI